MGGLLNAIVGLRVRFETLEGKFKLSQNVAPADAEGVRRGLMERADPASAAVAEHMRGVVR